MKPSTFYLLLCISGTVISWVFLIAFMTAHWSTPQIFLSSIFANNLATAVAADLSATAILFIGFVFVEGRRVGMNRLWIYVPATFLLGVVFGAGWFLFQRAKLLERAENT
ncbi:MAG: DUF2834 domain-containing protein [Stenotrophobium sp.]